MMTYFEIHPIYRMESQAVLLVLLAVQIYLFMTFVINIKRRLATAIQVIGIVMNMALLAILISEYQYLIRGMEPSSLVKRIVDMPLLSLILFTVSIIVLSIGSAIYFRKLEKKIITEKSIKESTDDLPMGLCFAKKDGMALLINRKMYMLGLMITGMSLQNAKHFWEQIVDGQLPEDVRRIKGGDEPVLILPNGSVWTFSKEYIKIEKNEVVQILAIDTTDMYKLSLELEKKNESLKEMNRRLQEYSDNVTELMREEEILATKVKIHADMGSVLLATRYYLNNPKGKEQAAELIKSWNYNVSLLYNEANAETKEDVFMHLNEAAKAVGVTIEVKGRMPRNNVKAERLIVAAARECLTNAVRHGDGNEVTIKIREEKKQYHVVYTNNGSAPEEDIKEGGGLMGLRKRVEDMQGNMQIISSPQFVLIVNIPKERK